jgi:hypothetical protein
MKGGSEVDREASKLVFETKKKEIISSQVALSLKKSLNLELKVTNYKQQIATFESNTEKEILPGDNVADSCSKNQLKSDYASKTPSMARIRYQRRNSATASMLISSCMSVDKIPKIEVIKANEAVGFLNIPHNDEGRIERSCNLINNHTYLTTEDALKNAQDIVGSRLCRVDKGMNKSVKVERCSKFDPLELQVQLEAKKLSSKPEMLKTRKRHRHEHFHAVERKDELNQTKNI